jgi:hypothetical protein
MSVYEASWDALPHGSEDTITGGQLPEEDGGGRFVAIDDAK